MTIEVIARLRRAKFRIAYLIGGTQWEKSFLKGLWQNCIPTGAGRSRQEAVEAEAKEIRQSEPLKRL